MLIIFPQQCRYGLKPGTIISGGPSGVHRRAGGEDPPPPLLEITEEIAAAAALVTEVDAAALSSGNSSLHAPAQKRASSFWMEGIARKGTVPWNSESRYKVFRNVKDYGARGDGKTDDTKAIMDAIKAWARCGERCNGASNKNAIVYFPQGTYLVSSPIYVLFGTQLVGDVCATSPYTYIPNP